jgi:ubiquinol-cytochrome c reductase subunit 7
LVSARPAVAEAIELADADVVKGRMRRLKRASDLSYKGKNYTDYKSADSLEPFKMELWDDVKKIEAREEEYGMLDLYKK